MARAQPKTVDQSSTTTHIRNTLTPLWPLPQKNASTLLHGDFWPENTLWQNEKLVAVIDWEDAERGDPLIDFAKSRSEIVWIFGVDAIHSPITINHA